MLDARMMREAIRLSRRGYPAPNPHVGCVISLKGEIVGRGYHDHAGGPHAEVEAIRDAGGRAAGATAYVTLEPCNHTGRTGPCSLALIEAGIRRVVIAAEDPNPRAQGGRERLAQAGVATEVGLLREEAEAVNRTFLHAIRTRRPYVVLKAACSLDGRIALPTGESQWITGPAARRAAHVLRAEMGAVLVGRRTVEMDDPVLTARIPGVVNQPLRVVLDPHARLGPGYRVFNDDAPTLHLTAGKVAQGEDGFELDEVLEAVRAAGAIGLLVEGGARTHAAFLRRSLVNRLEIFLAPKTLGEGPSWVDGLLAPRLDELPRFTIQSVRRRREDLQVTLTPNPA
ncbi:MAG TPA: bifunctional diaminohydroxyphosphoribosylaminopyrimidine deaminase/5-amino-6-(5-phosphoribosylamino)uracil reductase RibD [Fimbriimonas sp.]